MKTCAAIGEALIDFIPAQTGCALKDVISFKRVSGGAPCNITAAVAKLGGKSRMITKLGSDAFGDHICETLSDIGVDISSIVRTDEANTSLAFVSLKADGSRDFSFYRKPGADMLFTPDELDEKWLSDIGALHFCSVALVETPMKYAHIKAIELAQKNGALISFDPNIRLPLWNDHELCRSTVLDFARYADILKISDEELAFITGENDISAASEKLFSEYARLKMILFSKGKDGAEIIMRDKNISLSAVKVTAVDTTGAGDAIIGAFLYCLCRDDISPDALCSLSENTLREYLTFANSCSALSVTRNGAIDSYCTLDEINKFMTSQKEG